ncbi:MAG: phage Gp19/Gp15/Gp42 family protein [Kiritimatiellae bacterium]|nr:phage Gp19/Gp15/Gp42 family protein [Kiritimatiellia bacterium]
MSEAGTTAFATIDDITTLWRELSDNEKTRAEKLLEVVSDSLRQEAYKVGKDLDEMVKNKKLLPNVLKSVTVDVVARTLMTSTNQEPVTQVSQSGMGYSASATYLVPGGGLFIKKSELARLGLKRQSYGGIEFYGSTN